MGELAQSYGFTDVDGKTPPPAVSAKEMDLLIGGNRGLRLPKKVKAKL